MNIELRHLRSFLALADHLNFHRAAAELHLTQPALSRQIAGMEAELGCPLFTRTKRRVQLTQAGTYLYRHVSPAIDGVESVLLETRDAADGKRGSLALGYTEAAMASFLPSMLRDLRDQLPQVSLHLRQEHSEQLAREVARGRLDGAFISLPSQDEALKCVLVTREEMGIALPDNHPLAGNKEIALARLAREKFILFPYAANPKLYSEILSSCARAGFEPGVVEEASSWILAVNMVAAGVGISFLSRRLSRYCGVGTVFRPLKKPRPYIHFYLVEPAQGASPVLKELKRILGKIFKSG
ncbi:MAG: LysR family transcriptional regulator [Methylacidiphilales bacterium]|nr:LysR family transcriptional regulator [Candidatus Methylacidiphilales bacterium]